jgi:hypothetical protein
MMQGIMEYAFCFQYTFPVSIAAFEITMVEVVLIFPNFHFQ